MSVMKEILSHMDKNQILLNFANHIRKWFVCGELPQNLVEDQDFIPFYTPCSGHQSSTDISRDDIDGPLPMVAYCSLCKQEKREGVTSNGYSKPCPQSETVINPLLIDWSEEEDREVQEILATEFTAELPLSTYSPTLS